MKLKNIFKLLRIHQYIKNLCVFAPFLFAFHFTIEGFVQSALAFVLFSLIASSIYVFNDLMDIEEDRQHPTKQFRPLASGNVTKREAYILLTTLAGVSLLTASLVAPKLAGVLGFYFLLNIAYSVRLKHIPIVDIFFIATGFVLRVFAGAFATGIPPSMWIIIMTFLLALFMALAKRRDDVLLASEGRATRKNIDGYNLEFVNAAMSVMSAVIIGSYIQYTVSEEVVQRLGTHYLYLTSMFVILGIMRYMQITFVQGASGSPTTIFLKDRFLQLTILLWLLSFFGIVLANGIITAVVR